MTTALFYFARAATYEGPGALSAADRKNVMAYVQRAYKGFHGSDEGFNNLIAAAKSSALPPPEGIHIKTATELAEEQQKKAAEASKAKLDKSGRFPRPIVTQIEPAPKFWRAEEYHQQYLAKRGQSHCAI